MTGEPRDPSEELARGMEAAGALIESLEEEVANLRRDLEQASVALRAAQEEVSARGHALEEKDHAHSEAEKMIEDLRDEIDVLKTGHSKEQLRLRNEHANELADLRRQLEERRLTDVGGASSEERAATLKEEFRREQEALEQRHKAEIEALKISWEQWEEKLREGYREQEERHKAELETTRLEVDERKVELEQQLKVEFERRFAEQQREASERHEAALQALRTAAAGRELELREDYQAVVETQQAEIESLREQMEQRSREAEDLRKKELREVKALAETRDRELRLEESRIQRDTEVRAYTARLEELEAARLAQKTSAEEDLERVVKRFGEEISELESRIAGLEDALGESEALRGKLETELAGLRVESGDPSLTDVSSGERQAAVDEPEGRLEKLDAERVLAEERISDLETRLREAQEESRRNAEELEGALERLRRLAEPERRLRDGLALFNTSEHARAVASISKALGLPHVHAGLAGDPPGKPVLTFVWGDMAWRRYVSDPTEGVEEPRVYLTGTGDDPAEIEAPDRQPNARMDAQGRLILGVQAR